MFLWGNADLIVSKRMEKNTSSKRERFEIKIFLFKLKWVMGIYFYKFSIER